MLSDDEAGRAKVTRVAIAVGRVSLTAKLLVLQLPCS